MSTAAEIERTIWKWRFAPVKTPNVIRPSVREGFSASENRRVYERDRFAQPDYVLVGRETYFDALREGPPKQPGEPLKIADVPVLYVPDLPPTAIHVVTKFGSR